jgi:MoaA/NifB/PqqE/SkfB family radical SAM enzyme
VRRLQTLAPVRSMTIGGGEPLLHPDLLDVVRGVEALGVHTTLGTHGGALPRELCQRLVDAGLRQIDVAIDDLSRGHNELRGVPRLFEQATTAIHLLRVLCPEMRIGVSTLICAANIARLPGLVEWLLDELPIDTVRLRAYTAGDGPPCAAELARDPLWPTDPPLVTEVLGALRQRATEDRRIANPPRQLDALRDYFLDPARDLGGALRCPAGAFLFNASSTGIVRTCVLAPEVGDLRADDPQLIYDRFLAARQRARFCTRGCAFLLNTPLDDELWRAWDEAAPLCAGRTVLPPEAREIVDRGQPGYWRVVSYDSVRHLDVIGGDADSSRRRPPCPASPMRPLPEVFLAGDTSEVHRWGADLDEDDFFRQLAALRELHSRGAPHHTVVGVRRTNIHRLPRIYDLVRSLRGLPPLQLPALDLRDPVALRERAARHVAELDERGRAEGIELRVVDDELPLLLATLERAPTRERHTAHGYLLALGPVCKDVFTGPQRLLLDLAGRCNLDCVYCRLFSPWRVPGIEEERLHGFMPLAMVEGLIENARRLGVQLVLLVGRGEPTLHPDFETIIDLLRDARLPFNMSTNGTLLHRTASKLVDGRCDSITVSLSFASEASFRLIRPGARPSMLRRIEDNVRQLADLRRATGRSHPELVALYAICKHNCREVLAMAHHAHRLGADSIWYQLVHLEDYCRAELAMSEAEMAGVRAELREARGLCARLGIRWHSFIDFELEHYDERRGDWSREGLLHQGCYVPWHFAFVNLCGEVQVCCAERIISMVGPEGHELGEIWRGDLARRYRNDALIMHRENPIDLYGTPLYGPYCDSCDNHDQQLLMRETLRRYELERFVER